MIFFYCTDDQMWFSLCWFGCVFVVACDRNYLTQATVCVSNTLNPISCIVHTYLINEQNTRILRVD